MRFLPNTRFAGIKSLPFQTNSISPSDQTSAVYTRKASPVSSTPRIASTTLSSSHKDLPGTSCDQYRLTMDPSQSQSGITEKSPQNDKATPTDKWVSGQGPAGSASLNHSEKTGSHRSVLDHTTSPWQNIERLDMVTVGGPGTTGRQLRAATEQQNAETDHNFVVTPSLEHSQDILAGENFGRPGQPYITHHMNAEMGSFDHPEGDLRVLQGQRPRRLDNDSAGQGPGSEQQQRPGAVGETSFGLLGDPGIQRARMLQNSPSDNCHGREGIHSDWTAWNSHPRNTSPSTGEKGHHSGLTWNSFDTNEEIAATPDLYRSRPNGYTDGEEYHVYQHGLLVARGRRNSYGSAVVPSNLDSQFENSLSKPNPHQAQANFRNAGGPSQINQLSQVGSHAAQSWHNGQPSTCDAGGQLHSFAGGKVPAEDLEEQSHPTRGQNLGIASIHNKYDDGKHGSLVPGKLYDVHKSGHLSLDFRPNAPQNVLIQRGRLSVHAGPSDGITPYHPILHNSTGSPASTIAADRAASQYQHQHEYTEYQHNNLSTSPTPGFYSPIVPSTRSSNAPSVDSIPYVAVSDSFAASAIRNNTNNFAAPSRRFNTGSDTLPSTNPSPSFTSPGPSSLSKPHIANMLPPHGIVLSDADLEHAMAYCFDRGNGQYTRLVPIDILPFSLRDLPARVSSHEGMIVLPVPRMVDQNVQPGNVQLIPYVAGSNVTVSSPAVISPCMYFLSILGRRTLRSSR